jgi:CBS domain-containing protein
VGVRVGDICNPDVTTIEEDTTLTDIATIMTDKDVDLLPVMSNGKLVGIVGKEDVLKAFSKD